MSLSYIQYQVGDLGEVYFWGELNAS